MCRRASQPSPPGQLVMLVFNRLGGGNFPKMHFFSVKAIMMTFSVNSFVCSRTSMTSLEKRSFVVITAKKCMCRRASQPSPPGQLGMLVFNRLGGGIFFENACLFCKSAHVLMAFCKFGHLQANMHFFAVKAIIVINHKTGVQPFGNSGRAFRPATKRFAAVCPIW